MSNPKKPSNPSRTPHRRRRTTGAQSQRTVRRARVASSCGREITGGHPVQIRAVHREPPDLDRFVAALLALALAEHQTSQDDTEADERS